MSVNGLTHEIFVIVACGNRAYSGSEFVVANTLAKSKKLEPNEINLSQGFSQEVRFVFNSVR